MNSPRHLITNFNLTYDAKQILGGEAALWSEQVNHSKTDTLILKLDFILFSFVHQVDSTTMEGKLWPRGAALAERLWTDPDTDWKAAEMRMYHHRQRMVQRGILADALQHEWCHQNEGFCFL